MHPDYTQPLADYVRYYAEQCPDRLCCVDGDKTMTYRTLQSRSNQVANGLMSLGLEPAERIGYIGVNSSEYLEVFFGAMKARAICVGVNWRLAEPELEYILRDSGLTAVFCDANFVPLFERFCDTVPTLKYVISVEAASFKAWRESFDERDPNLPHDLDDPVVQFYTSGTTGKPKGVVLSNRAMAEHRKAEDQNGDWYLNASNHEIIINAMPNFHVGGLGWILMGMFRGAEVVMLPAPDPEKFLDLIEQRRATHLFAVPVILAMMLESQKKQPRDISSLRAFHYGSSSIAPSILKEAIEVMGCGFAGYYGMTENNGVVTLLPPDQHDPNNADRLRSCGRALAGTQIKIIDESGHELPAGKSGEIVIKSPGLMSGYWNKPEATSEVIIDGWYHTGDGGRLDDEGFLYIADRIKDMVISGGENIYPTEIENALITHPAVAEVAVIGVPDEKWGESVKAVIVLAPGESVAESELIDFLRPLIAGYKIPRIYDFADSIPRNAFGKIQKFKLK